MLEILRDFWYSYTPEYRLYLVVVALFIPLTIAGFVVQIKVNSTFNRCAVNAQCGLTAAQVARRILDKNGLYTVKIVHISGHLTDNFNPVTNTLSLSHSVYNSTTVSAIGVACHEAGHAIQHAKKYVFSSLRLKLVPVVNFCNRALFPFLLIGMLFGFASPYTLVGRIFIWIGLILFGASLLFSLVTLPTEFDASRRAQKELKENFFFQRGSGYVAQGIKSRRNDLCGKLFAVALAVFAVFRNASHGEQKQARLKTLDDSIGS